MFCTRGKRLTWNILVWTSTWHRTSLNWGSLEDNSMDEPLETYSCTLPKAALTCHPSDGVFTCGNQHPNPITLGSCPGHKAGGADWCGRSRAEISTDLLFQGMFTSLTKCPFTCQNSWEARYFMLQGNQFLLSDVGTISLFLYLIIQITFNFCLFSTKALLNLIFHW